MAFPAAVISAISSSRITVSMIRMYITAQYKQYSHNIYIIPPYKQITTKSTLLVDHPKANHLNILSRMTFLSDNRSKYVFYHTHDHIFLCFHELQRVSQRYYFFWFLGISGYSSCTIPNNTVILKGSCIIENTLLTKPVEWPFGMPVDSLMFTVLG